MSARPYRSPAHDSDPFLRPTQLPFCMRDSNTKPGCLLNRSRLHSERPLGPKRHERRSESASRRNLSESSNHSAPRAAISAGTLRCGLPTPAARQRRGDSAASPAGRCLRVPGGDGSRVDAWRPSSHPRQCRRCSPAQPGYGPPSDCTQAGSLHPGRTQRRGNRRSRKDRSFFLTVNVKRYSVAHASSPLLVQRQQELRLAVAVSLPACPTSGRNSWRAMLVTSNPTSEASPGSWRRG